MPSLLRRKSVEFPRTDPRFVMPLCFRGNFYAALARLDKTATIRAGFPRLALADMPFIASPARRQIPNLTLASR